MENLVSIRIEKLEEGGYLATSKDFEDLIAQGETLEETLDIAHDVAKKLIDSYVEHGDPLPKCLQKRKLSSSTFVVPIRSAAASA